jgi:adenine phosphoribosyltransferase
MKRMGLSSLLSSRRNTQGTCRIDNPLESLQSDLKSPGRESAARCQEQERHAPVVEGCCGACRPSITMGAGMDVATLRAKIRDIKDFPTEGILFKDITTLLKDGPAFRAVVDMLAENYAKERVDVVVGIESRGFIFGGAVAHQLGAGFVPVRKLGKLPGKTIEVEYELEYGRGALAVHEDAVKPGQRVLAVDDLLATGGTMAATLRLVQQLGGKVVGVAFMIELAFLKGREKLKGYPLHSLIVYE